MRAACPRPGSRLICAVGNETTEQYKAAEGGERQSLADKGLHFFLISISLELLGVLSSMRQKSHKVRFCS